MISGQKENTNLNVEASLSVRAFPSHGFLRNSEIDVSASGAAAIRATDVKAKQVALDLLQRPCNVDGVRHEQVSLPLVTGMSSVVDGERAANLVDILVVFKEQKKMGTTKWTRQPRTTARKYIFKVGLSQQPQVVLDKRCNSEEGEVPKGGKRIGGIL